MTVSGATVRVVGLTTLVSPLYASPATAANCILTDYQHKAVNHQQRGPRGKRVRGCFQSVEMEKNMSKPRQTSREMKMSKAHLWKVSSGNSRQGT